MRTYHTMRYWLLAALLLPVAGFGHGSSDAAGLTILPWNGAFLEVQEKEKRLSISFADSLGSFQYKLDASAPLNGEEHRASFAADNQLASGFKASVFVGYDSNLALLGAMASDARRRFTEGCDEFLKANPGKVCAGDNYEAWKQKNPPDSELRLIPGMPQNRRLSFVMGGEAAVAFDHFSGLRGDLAARPEDFSQVSGSVGLRGTLYYAPFLASSLRAGFQYEDGVELAKVNRCEALSSTDPNVSGSRCEETVLVSVDAEPSSSAYVETALTLVLPREISGATPGFEARVRLSGIGGTKKLLFSPTFFLSPIRAPVVTKFGVGFDAIRALDADPDGQFSAGKWWFVPFAAAGVDF